MTEDTAQPTTIEVFLSYSREDLEFAENVQGRLRESGIRCWVDHAEIRGGDRWSDVIDQGIRQCDALVLIVTPASCASSYVLYEWAFAAGLGVPVIPLLRAPGECHPRLQVLQHIDFTDTSKRPWDVLVQHLREKSVERGHRQRDRQIAARLQSASSDLRSRDHELVASTADWLADLKDARADEILLQVAEERLPVSLMLAVAKRGLAGAVPRLVQFCGHMEQPTRQGAVAALLSIAAPETVELIEVGLQDYARMGAHECYLAVLAKWKDRDRVVPIVLDYLARVRLLPPTTTGGFGMSSEDCLRAAAKALGEQRAIPGAPVLLSLLSHPKWHVVESVVEALGAIGDASAVEPLIESLAAPRREVAMAAIVALGRCGGEQALQALARMAASCTWENEYERISARRVAVETLAAMGDSGVLALREIVEGGNGEARAAVAELVRKQRGPAGLVPALIPLLGDRASVVFERTGSGDRRVESSLSDVITEALVAEGSRNALAALESRRDGGQSA